MRRTVALLFVVYAACIVGAVLTYPGGGAWVYGLYTWVGGAAFTPLLLIARVRYSTRPRS